MQAYIDSVNQSSGGWFDPELASAFVEHGPVLLAEMDGADAFESEIQAEPHPWRQVTESGIDRVAARSPIRPI